MIHGDADNEVCILNCLLGQSFALCAHDDSQTLLCLENRVGEGNAVVAESHSSGLEAQIMQLSIVVKPSPWH